MRPIVMQVEDVGKSEGCIVTMQIQANVWHESELTSDWSSVAREFEELYSRRNANDDFNRD
ncbi:hypothetical protein BOO92_21550 [Vibrio navarrensis]|nr:hypothetical protein UF06_05625 [Vibrio sp. S234-5]MBE3654316.1 hypothetical protein [Vibrio navarrensis]MBE3659239.1 hypothetical protein [Vibrio navarrensis]MBE4605975.1 hypothetical protein [Vibrio navarrensis]